MEVDISTLNPQQLAGLKKQLEEELDHLSASFSQLHAVQSKFRECLRCIQAQAATKSLGDNTALVPLTNSLYVEGKLSTPDMVIVDVGTGFFISKSIDSARQFYDGKMQDIGANIQNLEGVVEKKSGSLRLVEDVLRRKLASAQ